MNLVLTNVMACDVSDGFHREGLSTNLDFIAFHHLLTCGADLTHTCVNTSMLSVHQFNNSQLKMFTLNQADVP